MFTKGKVFLAGFCLFFAGFVIPFFIRLIMGAFGAQPESSSDTLYYIYLVGTVVGLCIGLPMIVLGIFMKRTENRTETAIDSSS